MNTEEIILYYDGNCGLCNHAVRFIIRHDKNRKITIRPLHSKTPPICSEVTELAQKHDSVILLYKKTLYINSDVLIQIGRILEKQYYIFSLLRLIPKSIRDGIYKYIAKNRKRWFKQQNFCDVYSYAEGAKNIHIKNIEFF